MTWSHAQLRHDLRYYTTVIACNAVGRCSEVTSDGVMIDVMPPVTGPVWDGAGDEDIAYQSQRSVTSCCFVVDDVIGVVFNFQLFYTEVSKT